MSRFCCPTPYLRDRGPAYLPPLNHDLEVVGVAAEAPDRRVELVGTDALLDDDRRDRAIVHSLSSCSGNAVSDPILT